MINGYYFGYYGICSHLYNKEYRLSYKHIRKFLTQIQDISMYTYIAHRF